MKRATIAGIFYQAAQITAMILTAALRALVLTTHCSMASTVSDRSSIWSLRVSRDYELEADQLGVQYAWDTGYDPGGFIRFFDKVATREGYVNGASWFRTHPPFYERMVDTRREIMFLPD